MEHESFTGNEIKESQSLIQSREGGLMNPLGDALTRQNTASSLGSSSTEQYDLLSGHLGLSDFFL
jgi:hypothetical protein